MEVAKDVFLDTIDNSPKFRTKYIEEKIKQDGELTKLICEIYELNLVRDIYYLNIVKESFNSKKRTELKFQEIMLIKKLLIYQNVLQGLINITDQAYETDDEFTFQFKRNFHSEQDRALFQMIINDITEMYFNSQEYRNR